MTGGKPIGFNRPAVRRISNVVRQAERDHRSQPLANTERNRQRRAVPVYNQTQEVIPWGGIVWMFPYINGVFGGQKVQYPGVRAFGIATDNIGPGQTGSAFVDGVAAVLVDTQTFLMLPLYFRLVLTANQWYATIQGGGEPTVDVGPLLVLSRHETKPNVLYVRMDGTGGCVGG